MESLVIGLVLVVAVFAVGAKLYRAGKSFHQDAPSDCGCGRGAKCHKPADRPPL